MKIALVSTIALGTAMMFGSNAWAVDKFKVTSAQCDQYYLWQRTPVVHFDIVPERVHDYDLNPPADYFAQPALRVADWCYKQPDTKQNPLGPSHRIKGIWFQSNDDQVKFLYMIEGNTIDGSVTVNHIGDRASAERKHQQELADIKARNQRQIETQRAEEQARRDAEQAEIQERIKTQEAVAASMSKLDLSVDAPIKPDANLSTSSADQVSGPQATTAVPNSSQPAPRNPITPAVVDGSGRKLIFTDLDAIRANPFRFDHNDHPDIVEVVNVQFTRMIAKDAALFGSEENGIVIYFPNPRMAEVFVKSGQPYKIAFTLDKAQAEQLHDNLPDQIKSMLVKTLVEGVFEKAFPCKDYACQQLASN